MPNQFNKILLAILKTLGGLYIGGKCNCLVKLDYFLKNVGFWKNANNFKHVLWKMSSLLTYADEVMVLVTSFASILHEKSKISSITFHQQKYS